MNLGELYIKISVDTSEVDSLRSAFNSAASAAESAGRQMDSAFSGTGNATNSTKNLSDALQDAVTKGTLLGSVMENAFNLVTDLAGKAANAVVNFIGESVSSFADYEQNLDAMKRTFGGYTDDFTSWMQENASVYGMTMNEMMEHANNTGVILQKDNAQRRAKELQGEQESTEQQKHEIDVRLNDFKSMLSSRETELKRAQSDELEGWKNYYEDEYDNLKSALSQELSEFKNNNDAIYESRRRELESQLSLLSDTLDAEYDLLKSSLDKQVEQQKKANERYLDNRQSAINAAYDATKKILDAEVDYQKKSNEKALDDKKKAVEEEYNAAKKSMDAEVSAFQKATDQRVREINREYTERYKLIDEQKYIELKALQDRIDAIDAEQDAADKAAQERTDADKLQELRRKYDKAESDEERAKAEKNINDYLLKIQERTAKEERNIQKAAIKEEMEAVKERYDNLKSELKEQQSEEVYQYKETRKDELAELKANNAEELAEIKARGKQEVNILKENQSEQIKAMQAHNKERLANMKAAGQAEIKQLKSAQSDQIKAMQERNKSELAIKKKQNDEIIKNQRQQNSDELAELKSGFDAQEKEMSDAHNRRLKEEKRFQDEQLKNLKNSQADELDALKEHNRKLLEEETYAANERKKALAEIAKQVTYAEPDDEDRWQSVQTLQKLFKTAADVGAARNMTTDQVLDIFESMNYGRFATFDNLGLGYANKSGIQQMVAEMGQKIGRQLDPEDFNDVAIALEELIDTYGMTNAAAKESKETVSGIFKSVRADWENFKTALATETEDDDMFFLNKLFGTDDEDGSVEMLIDKVVPIVVRVIERLIKVVQEKGPEIIKKIKEAIPEDIIPPQIKEKIDAVITAIGDIAVAIANLAPHTQTIITFFEAFAGLSAVNKGLEILTGESGLSKLGKKVSEVFGAGGATETVVNGAGAAAEALGGAEAVGGAGSVGGASAAGGGLSGAAAAAGGVLTTTLGATAMVMGPVAGLGMLMRYQEDETHRIRDFAAANEGNANEIQVAWEKASERVNQEYPKISGGLANMGQSADELKEQFGKMSTESQEQITNLADKAKETAEGTGNWTDVVKTKIGEATQFIRDKMTTDMDTTSTNVKVSTASMDTGWSQSLESMKKNTENATSTVKVQTSGMLTEIKNHYDGSGNLLKDSGNKVVAGFKDGAENGGAWDNVKNFFSGVLVWIKQHKGPIEEDEQALQPAGNAIMRGFYEGSRGTEWSNVQEFYNGVSGVVEGTFNGSENWLSNNGESVIEGLKNGFNSQWSNSVEPFMRERHGIVLDFFADAQNWLGEKGNDIMNGLHSGIDGAWGAVNEFFNNVGDNIWNSLGDTGNLLFSSGQNIISGLYDGLLDVWNNSVVPFVQSMSPWIQANDGPEYEDKHLLVPNGKNMITGLYNGLKDGFENKVAPFVTDMSDDMQNMMDDLFDVSNLTDNFEDGLDKWRDTLRIAVDTYKRSLDEMLMYQRRYADYSNEFSANTITQRSSGNVQIVVQQMNVRSEQDIYSVAQELDRLYKRQMAGALV